MSDVMSYVLSLTLDSKIKTLKIDPHNLKPFTIENTGL